MSETGLDVAACVDRVRRRDEDAARLLVNHLYPLVLKLVRAHRPRRTEVEDLVQTVFMKMFANLDRYSGTVPLEHWVSRIAINTCINQIKAEVVRPELRWADLSEDQARLLEELATTSCELPPDQSLAARDVVEKLLESLEPRERLLLTLLFLEGRSYAEAAEVTGWSGLVIRVRVFRARQKLKKRFHELIRNEAR
jgi:RNA polymerase sigma-70 factor (ECF subfamily)